jgi:hypothetical protein
MKLTPNQIPIFQVEMTKQELEFIRTMCQHPPEGNPWGDNVMRLNLFVGASRILGYDMNDDGSIKRRTDQD